MGDVIGTFGSCFSSAKGRRVTREEARTIAQRHLDESGRTEQGQRLVVYPSDEAVSDMGWCYKLHFNTERYVETGDEGDAMGPGMGPIAVAKSDGGIYEMGSNPLEKDFLVEWGRKNGYL